MTKEVTLTIEVDENIGTEEEMDSYIEYELGYSGSVANNNPYLIDGIEITDITID